MTTYLHPGSNVYHKVFGAGIIVDLSTASKQVGVKFGNKKRYVNVKSVKKIVSAIMEK
jgi:transcription elongation factor GreA-like protein